jgi:hypothetical protein
MIFGYFFTISKKISVGIDLNLHILKLNFKWN